MKLTILAVFLSVLALSSGAALSGVQQKSSYPLNIGEALKMWYMSIKSIMPCGYAPLDIPVLAPYTVNNINLNFSSDQYSLTGEMTNLYVSGLKSFVFLKFDFDATTGLLSYDTFVPEIQMLAESDIDFWVMVAGHKLDMSGKGLWDLKFESMRVVGSFVMAPNAMGRMQISNHKLNFYLGDVKVNNWYDSWNIAGNNFYNQWLRNFILMMTQQGQQEINDMYNDLLMPYINEEWAQATQEQLISYLIEESAAFSMAGCKA